MCFLESVPFSGQFKRKSKGQHPFWGLLNFETTLHRTWKELSCVWNRHVMMLNQNIGSMASIKSLISATRPGVSHAVI